MKTFVNFDNYSYNLLTVMSLELRFRKSFKSFMQIVLFSTEIEI